MGKKLGVEVASFAIMIWKMIATERQPQNEMGCGIKKQCYHPCTCTRTQKCILKDESDFHE